jgi:hypothetical protein
VLQTFERALRLSGSRELNELREFQALLTEQGDRPVTKLITDLKKKLAPQGRAASEPVERLKVQLNSLSEVLLNAGAKTSANEISKVSDTLAGDFQSVAQLVEHVLHQSEPAPFQSAVVAVREEIVQSYLKMLHNSEGDNGEFDRNIALLKVDKRVRKEEMREIAKRYLGYEIAKKKGKGPALQEIINYQALNARQVARSTSH